jgi:hypothetical protein
MSIPREFFEEIVKPAVALWGSDKTSVHLAVHALAQIDILAEEIFRHQSGTGTPPEESAAKYRKYLRDQSADLGLAWDAHDSHKHGPLTRHTAVRLITQGQRPKVVDVGRSYLSRFVIGRSAFGRRNVMCLLTDKGSRIPLEGVLNRCIDAWDKELLRLGL